MTIESQLAAPQASGITDNARKEIVVYLAGPITGLSYEQTIGWRTELQRRFSDTAPHVRCLDPMRAKDHLAGFDNIGAFGHPGGLLDGKAVVSRDLWDVARADVVLMNLSGAETISIGCMVELGWARAQNKFVVVVLPLEERRGGDGTSNPHDHLFVLEVASAVVDDLPTAASIIESM
jgi:nucleoside 2-deoxyribosyltransferase